MERDTSAICPPGLNPDNGLRDREFWIEHAPGWLGWWQHVTDVLQARGAQTVSWWDTSAMCAHGRSLDKGLRDRNLWIEQRPGPDRPSRASSRSPAVQRTAANGRM